MSEQSPNLSGTALRAVAEVNKLFTQLKPAQSDVVETDIIGPAEICDDAGRSLKVTKLCVTDLGHIDSEARTILIEIAGAPDKNGDYSAMHGLLHDYGDKAELLSTDIRTIKNQHIVPPPISAYRVASPELTDDYATGILFGANFDIDILLKESGLDKDDQSVGYTLAVEHLANSCSTIPGITYMGKVLMGHDQSPPQEG